jgi:hypothetical protein
MQEKRAVEQRGNLKFGLLEIVNKYVMNDCQVIKKPV